MLESGGAIGERSEPHFSSAWQESLAALPRVAFGAGETVVTQGRKTGQLLILKSGAVMVAKNGLEIARVAEPGAVFGELSALLDEPHTADVRTIVPSEFYVTDAKTLLTREPMALLYVATLLARRLDLANRGLLEIKGELESSGSSRLVGTLLAKVELLISFIVRDYDSTGAVHSIR
jgi:CRP/FNR family transcriptional regulator, cyclic AMP receptor protein